MTLEELGYTPEFEKDRKEKGLTSFEVGRVISEHRERYVVRTAEKEYDGEIIGNLRYSAQDRSDFPAVGDWVSLSVYDDDKALIHAVLRRKTVLERQAVGKKGEKQLIAANIDVAFIVQAVDSNFNLNRIERYLTLCAAAKVTPIVVLNKIDLMDETELSRLIATVHERKLKVPVLPISNETKKGINDLKECIKRGKTYCLLGSSGVGKSTLLNNLSGNPLMKTDSLSVHTNKGRHVTTHRELIVLEQGGIIVDNPGMREVGITESAEGLERTFDAITELSNQCRFTDCTHTSEKGCAVVKAVENGILDKSSYQNYLKMEREKEHFEATVAEKRKKDKEFGKMIKNYKKDFKKK